MVLTSEVRAEYAENVPRLQQDTSLEVEILMGPTLMGLLTTEDGTLSPLLSQGAPPEWLTSWAHSKGHDSGHLGALAWDELDYEHKLKLLQHYSPKHPEVFLITRKIFGLKVRDEAEVSFSKPTILFGKRFKSGRYVIKISDYFKGQPEYGGSDCMAEVSLVELHVRSNVSAGNVLVSSAGLLEALDFPAQSYHVHIVGLSPYLNLKISSADRPLGRVAYVEYLRRLNLITEFISILEGYPINTIKNSRGGVVFGPFTGEGFFGVVNDVIGSGGEGVLLTQDKPRRFMAYVAPRNNGTYDTTGLLGLEFHAISRRVKLEPMGRLLDRVQQQILDGDYGLSDRELRNWIAHSGFNLASEADLQVLLMQSYYNNEIAFLQGILSSSLSFKQKFFRNSKRFIELSDTIHNELKMLVHDWSQDPIIYRRPWLRTRIAYAQWKALDQFSKNENINVNALMKKFLQDSGLAQAFFESVGLDANSCEEFLR